jgi:predicted nucleotidyltransferase
MFGLDPETLFNIRQAIAKVETIDKVLLYGSRAKGNYRNGSDIDITLLGENLTLENSVYRLMDEIEELYLPYSFDISIFEHIDNTNLKEHIERVGVVFYQRETMKQGWKVKKLGEVIKLEYGKPLDNSFRKSDGLYPIYGANGVKGRTDKFYCDKETIIVGRKGSAGEINLSEAKFWPLDVTYFVTFDNTENDLQFLYYLLSKQQLTKLAKGVKPGINRNEVYDLSVLLHFY